MSQRKFITDLVAQKYQSYPIGPDTPQPIEITVTSTGPLSVNRGSVLCDLCGSIVRQSYFSVHQSSGACARAAERRKENDEKRKLAYQSRSIEPISTETNLGYPGAI